MIKIDNNELEKRLKSRQKVALIDFDGVIHGYREGWKSGKPYDDPVPGCKEAIDALKLKGYKICIHSARFFENDGYCEFTNVKEQKKFVTEYLNKHDIYFDELIPKAFGDVYIDDRAIRCNPYFEPENSWENVLESIDNYTRN